jgi:hypothetical protein
MNVMNDEIVSFNVGGQTFATLKSTLTKKIFIKDSQNAFYESNILDQIVSNTSRAKLDHVGSIFIDRNPKYFELILDYLRSANSDNHKLNLNELTDLEGLFNEAKFFKIKGLLDLIIDYQGLDSLIIKKDQISELLDLCEFPVCSKWKLLYRGTRDGFGSEEFHFKCDHVPKTLSLIKSHSGNVFGGFTEQTWAGNGYKSDPNAFIFSLINQEKKPIKMMSQNSSSIYCSPSCSVAFGKGHDFCIASNENNNNYSYLGPTYRHPGIKQGSEESHSFLAGTYNFEVVEIEVFQLLN